MSKFCLTLSLYVTVDHGKTKQTLPNEGGAYLSAHDVGGLIARGQKLVCCHAAQTPYILCQLPIMRSDLVKEFHTYYIYLEWQGPTWTFAGCLRSKAIYTNYLRYG